VLATLFGAAEEGALVVDGDALAPAAPPVALEGVGVGAMLKVVLVTTPLNGPELFPLDELFAAGTRVAIPELPPFGG
jgi:hypothetical protein